MVYDSNYFKSRKRTGFRFTAGKKFLYYSRLLQIMRSFYMKGNLLDIGCGEGRFLSYASIYFSVYGMDISNDAIIQAKSDYKDVNFKCISVDELTNTYDENYFEIITILDVLEHLKKPNKTINDITKILKKNGLLLISVPNSCSLGKRMKQNKWFAYRDETHISLLDKKSWITLLKSNGFFIESLKTDGLWDSPYIPLIPAIIQHIIFKFFYNFCLFIGYLPKNIGENLLIVAIKKD